ncbi:MAG: ATP-binding cassette domain-containing protein [Bacteroidales bacterium]|nr:ATP-binding cassette domain-containing protein [Bacteroidales bacterium]
MSDNILNTICLDSILPKVFVGQNLGEEACGIWQREVQFSRGESILIEAESGRGKTSLCSFLSGLRSDYEGQIRYLKSDGSALEVDTSTLLLRHIGILFQEHRLFGELSAVENVMLKSQLTRYATEEEVRRQLERLGLADCMDRPCRTLSLGQQQRVAFVRALCQPCSFLLLDEPISHLDADNADIMSQMVAERQQTDGIGLIVTSVGHRFPYQYTRIFKL